MGVSNSLPHLARRLQQPAPLPTHSEGRCCRRLRGCLLPHQHLASVTPLLEASLSCPRCGARSSSASSAPGALPPSPGAFRVDIVRAGHRRRVATVPCFETPLLKTRFARPPARNLRVESSSPSFAVSAPRSSPPTEHRIRLLAASVQAAFAPFRPVAKESHFAILVLDKSYIGCWATHWAETDRWAEHLGRDGAVRRSRGLLAGCIELSPFEPSRPRIRPGRGPSS
ncbi:hypothetical protein AAHA92_08896 [Salvia divinorum]|uniref:Uncharacterized protein n=1 Tax=Salvia divinorum TaxID=28513 RepID=A0ABD1HR29_SALDI